MRLSIFREDGKVYIEGRAMDVDCSSIDPNIRVIQWDGTHGHIEFADAGYFRANGYIDDIDEFADIVTAWETARDLADNPPPPPPPPLPEYAANKRWLKEIGGITIAGVPLATDDRSKLMIMGARLAAQSDSNWSTNWIGTDGGVYPVNAAQMIGLSDAVQSHVNNCFTIFASVMEQIGSGTIASIEQIDAAFA